MYIGAILPWDEFHQPDVTGITLGRLFALGLLVLLLRRIPAMMLVYKIMPNSVKTWKEALLMGYLGPIGIGAVFYVEHARHLYPKLDAAETHEEEDLLRAMGPVVYFLVLFSIVVHGLSIPALDIIYRWQKVPPIVELDPVTTRRLSVSSALPNNAHIDPRHGSVVQHNRFSRATSRDPIGINTMDDLERNYRKSEQRSYSTSDQRFGRSRSRPAPVTPTWRLTGATEGSDNTLSELETEKDRGRTGYNEAQREKMSISFEEGALRSRQRDDAMRPNTGKSDYSAQMRF